MEKKTIISCNSLELERIIINQYGHRYEISSMEEDQYEITFHNIKVSKEKLNTSDNVLINFLVNNKPKKYSLKTIMTDLCNKGVIEEGEYIIDVSW